jgi:hypothetical protein
VAAGAALILVDGHGVLLPEKICPILISNQDKSIEGYDVRAVEVRAAKRASGTAQGIAFS